MKRFLFLVALMFVVAGCSNDSAPSTPPVPDTPNIKELSASISTNSAGTITVTNTGTTAFHNFTIHLNESGGLTSDDGYVENASDLAPGQEASYNLADFAKSDGTKFQPSVDKLTNIAIETKDDQGMIIGETDYNLNKSN